MADARLATIPVPRMLWVFISSTWLDLREERAHVRDLVQRLRGLAFLGMEELGTQEENTEQASLAATDKADLYVGIIGARYGSGITEQEYLRAGERGVPRLIYLKRGIEVDAASVHAGTDDDARRRAFVERLCSRHTCVWFDSPQDLAYKLSLDLHNRLFDAHIVGGVGPVSSDYLSRVQAFVAEYTGTVERPVPFGGRNTELARLDAWLAEPDAPGCLLIAAAAGRGKSALLVRWSRQLLGSGAVVPLFLPISIRFGTSTAHVTFKSLLSCLGALHGTAPVAGGDSDIEGMRGRLADLLRTPLPCGRRLVLVLDGLDEAADWEVGPDLLPPHLGSHVRVVVSARLLAGDADAGGWLGRLGWDGRGAARAMVLPGLAAREVADALLNMEAPLSGLASREAFVHEMHRLSEGDPLLVRLYVEHLREQATAGRALSLADLQALRPGLEGYFKRWWRDQERLWGAERPLERLQVQALMDLLAGAFGPLSHDELLTLASEQAPWNSWGLRQALQPMRRFVVGDGASAGYVLSHPRLALHLRDQMSQRERMALDERFVHWCEQRWSEHSGGAADALSPYVVQFFGAHLDRMQAPAARFAPVLEDGWWRAWLALEGSIAGYRADLQRIERALAQAHGGADGDHVALAARCRLCIASVDEISRSTPSALIVSLVGHGLWGRAGALQYARAIEDPGQRSAALCNLAAGEPPGQRERIAHEVLLEFDAWFDGEPPSLRTLGGLAPLLAPESVGLALRKAQGHEAGSGPKGSLTFAARSRGLLALLPWLSPAQLGSVVDHALRLRDAGDRQDLLRALATTRPQVALSLAARSELDRWDALWILLAALPHLRAEELHQARTRARHVFEAIRREDSLDASPAIRNACLAVAQQCEPEDRVGWVQALLAAVAPERAAHDRLKVLFRAADLVLPEQRLEILERAFDGLRTAGARTRVDCVLAVAAQMDATDAERLLDAIADDTAEPQWPAGLAALLPRLPPGRRTDCILSLLALDEPMARIEACLPVVEHLTPRQCALLAEAACSDDLASPDLQYEWLHRLAPHLDPACAADLVLCTPAADPMPRLARVAALAARLPDASAQAAVQQMQAILRSPWIAAPPETAARYVDLWAGEVRPSSVDMLALELAAAIEDSHGGTPLLRRALIALGSRAGRAPLQRAVRALQVIGDIRERLQTIAGCFEQMPADAVLLDHADSWLQLDDDARGRLAVHWWVQTGRSVELTLDRVLMLVDKMPSDSAYLTALQQLLVREGQAPDALLQATAAAAALESDHRARPMRALLQLVDHLPPAALARHFSTILRGLLAESVKWAAAISGRVPPSVAGAAFAEHLERIEHAVAGESSPTALRAWADAWRFCWLLEPAHRRQTEPLVEASSLRLAPGARAQVVAALMPEVEDGSAGQASLLRLAADVQGEPMRLQVDIALLPLAGVRALPHLVPTLLARLNRLVDARRHELSQALPDGLLRDLAQAGAWRAALALHASGSGGLPVYGRSLEDAMMDEAQRLWLGRQRGLALALMLTLLPAFGTHSLRRATAATLRELRRWSGRDGTLELSSDLAGEWLHALLRDLLGGDAARRIRTACAHRAEHAEPPTPMAVLIGLVGQGTLKGSALAVLSTWSGSRIEDGIRRDAGWLEHRVREMALARHELHAQKALAALGTGTSRMGRQLLRGPRRKSPEAAWLMLLEAASGLDWHELRRGGQPMPTAMPAAAPATDTAPRRPRRADVMATLLAETQADPTDSARAAAALAEAVLEAGRRWP